MHSIKSTSQDCVAVGYWTVLRTSRHSLCCSILAAPFEASHLPAELTAARRRRGNPRSGLESAMAFSAPLCPVFPGPGKSAAGRGVGSEQPQRWHGNLHCSVRAGRAARRVRTSADALPLWSRMMWCVFRLPDVKAKISLHAPVLRRINAHLIISANSKRTFKYLVFCYQARIYENDFTYSSRWK